MVQKVGAGHFGIGICTQPRKEKRIAIDALLDIFIKIFMFIPPAQLFPRGLLFLSLPLMPTKEL